MQDVQVFKPHNLDQSETFGQVTQRIAHYCVKYSRHKPSHVQMMIETTTITNW